MRRLLHVAIVLALALAGCGGGRRAPADPPEGEAWLDPAALARGGVRIERAAVREIPQAVPASGRIDFDDLHVTHVFSPVSGRVARVLAQPGQKIRKGTPLVTILSPDVGAAFSDLVKAHADLLAAEADFDRQRRLAAVQANTARDVETAEDGYRKAEAEYDRARKKARLLRPVGGGAVTQEYPLVSYLDGEVISRAVSPGMEVQGQYSGASSAVELFTIGDTSRLWVLADAYEVDLPRLHEGDPVEIGVAAAPGRTFRGTIDWISDVLDPQLRTLKVRCEIQNADRVLKPEMYEAVTVKVPGREVVTVPRQALLRVGDDRLVLVAKGERPGGRIAFERRVVLADEGRADGLVAVQGGLSGGEQVVVRGAILVLGAF